MVDSYTVPFLIGGKETTSQQTFDVVNPATGKAIHKSSSASASDADAAVAAAAEALPAWKATTPRQRRDVLLKAADVLLRRRGAHHKAADEQQPRRGEHETNMRDETGADDMMIGFNFETMRDIMIDVAGRVSTLEGSVPATQDAGVGAMVLQEPYGVVLAIAPW